MRETREVSALQSLPLVNPSGPAAVVVITRPPLAVGAMRVETVNDSSLCRQIQKEFDFLKGFYLEKLFL